MDKWNQLSALGGPTDAVRQLDIHSRLSALAGASGRLIDLVSQLEDRLAPAMSSSPPSNDGSIGCPALALCGLADEIQSRILVLGAAEERLASILRRLEF